MLADYWVYLVIALVIIIPLAVYAGSLLSQLNKQNQKQAIVEQEKQAALKKHDTKIFNSVVIIVKACDISEGCWRLSVLLDSLKLSSELHTLFPAIYELYNAIKHMPILEERKKLAKKERMKLDFERMKLEADLTSKIHRDLEQLHQYVQERLSVIAA